MTKFSDNHNSKGNPVWHCIYHRVPMKIFIIIGFLIFYSACCSELNRWIGLLIEKFESKLHYEEKETIQDCSRLIKEGLKKTNETFSCPLFWISSLYLTVLIICTYFATNFLSKVSLFTYKIVIKKILKSKFSLSDT